MKSNMTDDRHMIRQIRAAERMIQGILIELADAIGRDLDHVRIDTREFANLAVEIFAKDPATPRGRRRLGATLSNPKG